MTQTFKEYLAEKNQVTGPTEDELKTAIEGKIGNPFQMNLLKGSQYQITDAGLVVGDIEGNSNSFTFSAEDLAKFGMDSYEALGQVMDKYL